MEAAGEFKAINGRIDSLEKQMSSLRSEMSARFDGLEDKVTFVEDVTRPKDGSQGLNGKDSCDNDVLGRTGRFGDEYFKR